MKAFLAGAATSAVIVFSIQHHIKTNYNQVQSSLESARSALSVRMEGKEVQQPMTRPLTQLWNSGISKIAGFLTHIQ
jgi:hypothetical protein